MESSTTEVVRGQLEKILLSEGFARNDRLSGFLRFVVEQELAGRGDQLKESIIGVEVFGRRPDYDVRQDSLVRTEAARLRARLAEYYATGSATDPLIIELPKGGYKPVFRQANESGGLKPETTKTSPVTPVSVAGFSPWLAGVVCLIIVLAAFGWWRFHPIAPIPIAVLPLINLSQDPANDFFADGLTGELIRNLSIIEGLTVRSQTSSFVFKGKPQNARDAGKQLDAEYILEGSVMRSGQKLRINAQLVRARDDFPLWSGRYDRELTDVFAIQDEISRGIVNSLRLKLGHGRRRYETSTEAYDLYLRARALEIKLGGSGPNYSIDLYEKAIAKDPSFAPAYAGLGAVYAYRTGEDRINWEGPDREEEMVRMRVVVQKAVQLDPLLAEAHAALGASYARDGQWNQSQQSFRRAIELDPGSSFTRAQFALNILRPLGRTAEAVAQLRAAAKTDPLSPSVQMFIAFSLIEDGRIEEAATHCQPQSALLARVRLLQGRVNEAIPILEALYKDRLTKSGSGKLGYAYALAGRRQEAEKIAALQPRALEQAEIFVALGDKDRAFEALDRAIPLGPVRVGRSLNWPEFRPLRGDPRVKALRKKVGLPE